MSKYVVREEQIEQEVAKFRSATKKAADELNEVKESIAHDEVRKHAFIIDAHLLILQDRFFYDDIIDTIRKQRINAEWALDLVVSKFLSSFEKMEDFLPERKGAGFNHIHQRLLRIMVKGKASVVDTKGIRGKAIVVAHDLSPADTIQLDLNRIPAL